MSAALGTVALVGLPFGAVLALGVGWLAYRLLGSVQAGDRRQDRRRRRADLPVALDLVAECLRAGLPMARALEVVAVATDGRVSADLERVAMICRLGGSVPAAWSDLRTDPDFGPVARAIERSTESGSALSVLFHRLAGQIREEDALAERARAERAGVFVMVPLALCFLPAFVCLGIVPVVLGIANDVLG